MELRFQNRLDTSWVTLRNIKFSIAHDNYQIFKDDAGRSCGYVIWCKLGNYEVRNLIVRSKLPNYFCEWDSGNIFFILDIVFSKQSSSSCIQSSLKLFQKQTKISFLRKGKLKLFGNFDDLHKFLNSTLK